MAWEVCELGLNCFAKNLCQWWRHSAVSTVRTQKYRDGIRSFRDFRFGIQEGRETGDAGRPFEQKRLWKSNGVGAVPSLLIMVEQNMEGGSFTLTTDTHTVSEQNFCKTYGFPAANEKETKNPARSWKKEGNKRGSEN